MVAAMVASMLLHVIILLGVTFQFPQPKFDKIASSLEVVLVNNKTLTKPKETELLAQDNLDGGGNTDADRRAKTPFPVLPKSKPVTNNNVAQQKVKQLEQEAKKLMAAVSDIPQIEQPSEHKNEAESKQVTTDPAELLLRSLDIVRLRAQIDQDHDSYQKRPKRKFVGASAAEYKFAGYVEDWRQRIEEVGNQNYPEAARQNSLYGSLLITVAVRLDGSLENVEIIRSSGNKVLDAAAMHIVELAAPFSAFPLGLRNEADVLHITRTWTFTKSDTLISE